MRTRLETRPRGVWTVAPRLATCPFLHHGLTSARGLVSMETMVQRLALLLLVVALVSSGASAPFAHVHPPDRHDHGPAAIQVHSHSSTHDSDDAHWHVRGQEAHSAGEFRRFGSSHRHVSVVLAAVAVGHSTTSADAAPTLVKDRQAVVRPDLWGRYLTVPLSRLPNPPPRVGPSARAPPA